MRRITLWLLSTVAAVVLAFSYRTSTMGPGGSETAAVATVPPSPSPSASPPSAPATTKPSGDGTFDGNFRDQQINAYALPTLRQETLDAQSADIDAVSGATVTSDGYKQSLQSAIDAAHLK
jgi:hypothetical protein